MIATGNSDATSSSGFLTSVNVRQNTLHPFPASHSLDDSQLRVGYNSSSVTSGVLGASGALIRPVPRRKISANIPYVFSESDLDVNDEFIGISGSNQINRNSRLLPGDVVSCAGEMPSHQRTSSSPCRLMSFTNAATEAGGFTSEDEPELLELTPLSSLRRSTAKLLEAEPCLVEAELNQQHQAFTRVGSAKRLRVSPHYRYYFIWTSSTSSTKRSTLQPKRIHSNDSLCQLIRLDSQGFFG